MVSVICGTDFVRSVAPVPIPSLVGHRCPELFFCAVTHYYQLLTNITWPCLIIQMKFAIEFIPPRWLNLNMFVDIFLIFDTGNCFFCRKYFRLFAQPCHHYYKIKISHHHTLPHLDSVTFDG